MFQIPLFGCPRLSCAASSSSSSADDDSDLPSSRMMNCCLRRATHAGSWYSGDGRTLDAELTNWLGRANVTMEGEGRTRAIIGPHAGFR